MISLPLRTIERKRLTEAIASRFGSAGYSADAAAITASHLVQAEAEGYWSHGLRLVPIYLDEAAKGSICTHCSVELIADEETMLVFDGHGGPGHHVLATAIDQCIDRAIDTRVTLAWVSGLSHTGRLAYYVARATKRGASALLTVTSALDKKTALVSPPNSSKRLLGSNPLAIGVSGPQVEVCYDGSTAAIPFYSLLNYWETQRELPDPSVVDSQGRPSSDPDAFFNNGAIRPSGGARGFGLSIALTLLAQLRCPPTSSARTNAFALVIGPGEAFGNSLAQTVSALRAEGVHLPGSGQAAAASSAEIQTSETALTALRDAGVNI